MDFPRYSPESTPDQPTQSPDPKRRRLAPPSRLEAVQLEGQSSEVTSVDLTENEEVSEISKTQAKQRADAILAQQSLEPKNTESIFAAYKCPVCMDTPVDATSTVCGHLFCHKCITDTLKFSEERSVSTSKAPKGTCPVCRKPLSRNDVSGPKRHLIPLQIKLLRRKRREGDNTAP
ncbi:uncharacterized protein BO97DRAFT_274348 [Aspergillus homomorphus CBS 101889]|uniref:RING-type domain-containing protein n=1 Tax=Aspergillus homomorphus (strain CBS 101889) TaxID=1450537 RepID=A0A395I916_ASPHC|nr:hypothetical protein BO97DRAFT_274348 [Aspergillus homomorphus CBS 101889]RAL14634.1 hypothetical protein BO97DRAFT_274348 [Aspergillus homomorphus CBS 101889]